jgi:hypothetical protein
MAAKPKQPAKPNELIRRIRAVVERAGWDVRGSEVDSEGQVRIAANPKQ